MKNQVFSLQTFSFTRTFFTYVKIMMTYKGPMWVPHGLKFLYGTHMGPIWASCPDSAHMGLICQCVLGVIIILLNTYNECKSHLIQVITNAFVRRANLPDLIKQKSVISSMFLILYTALRKHANVSYSNISRR